MPSELKPVLPGCSCSSRLHVTLHSRLFPGFCLQAGADPRRMGRSSAAAATEFPFVTEPVVNCVVTLGSCLLRAYSGCVLQKSTETRDYTGCSGEVLW